MTWRSLGDSNPCFRRERARPAAGQHYTPAVLVSEGVCIACGLQ